MKKQRGQIGLVGEYAVLSALILHGFNAARMDGNSKDIDILCSNSDFSNAVRVQVKTQGPQTSYRRHDQPIYSFRIAALDRYQNYYRQSILDQKIHFIFYLCPQDNFTLSTSVADQARTSGRFFIATPEEVARQLDAQVQRGNKQLYFRLLAETDDKYCVEEGGVLVQDFENCWDKLRH